MKSSKAIFSGIVGGAAVIGLVLLTGAGLTKFVGQFYGNAFGVTNIANVQPILPTIDTPAFLMTHVDGTPTLLESAHVSVTAQGLFSGDMTASNTFRSGTNAFPLSAGTVWDLSRYHQFISTNASFVISALAGLSNNLLNSAELRISNSAATAITVSLNFPLNKIGSNTTNSIVLASAKQAYISVQSEGIGTVTNIVTLTEQ